jgi:hypothetical protein
VDLKLRNLTREYASTPTSELAHQIARQVLRSQGIPKKLKLFFEFFSTCGDCNEPTDTFDMCNYLGFNPGVDGHFFDSEEQANETWHRFINRVREERLAGRFNAGYWTELPFETLEEELDYLNNKIRLVEFYIVEND